MKQVKIISLLQLKQTILKEMLRLTRTTKFSNNSNDLEENIEEYASLYNKRQILTERLQNIENRMIEVGSEPTSTSQDVSQDVIDLVTKTTQENNEIIAKIILLDEENKKIGNFLTSRVRENIDNVNKRKRIYKNFHPDANMKNGLFLNRSL